MAIVHMSIQVEKFFEQLTNSVDFLTPNPQFFDYEGKKDVYLYSEEEVIELPDFLIEFRLIVTQTGVYDPGDHCQPPEFTEETTEVEIENLVVYDSVYGENLRLNRGEFTEIINKVRELIEI